MSDTKKTSVTEDVLRKAAKSTLDNSTALLDDDVRQRLQQARRNAMHAATRYPSRFAMRPSWVAAGSFAVLALVTSVVFYQYRPVSESSPMASIEDMPILTAPEELELYEELDFYQWLAEEHDSVG
ncbi:MAG: hypothetical protein PVF82_08470 [Gammaproteobacteria bacterium]|jgi:hypothetical protein